jgi:hypothetical protein
MATKPKTDPKKTGPKKKLLSTAPSFQFGLTFDTAASLHHLMTAQYVHAEQCAEEGFPILKECFGTVDKFYQALSTYLDKYS